MQTAIREVREETGLVVEAERLTGICHEEREGREAPVPG